ncbi:MAG: AraC family transcriptional regulator [Candidatus Marinimicrobia bacterium]|nr:AraC family transcriptional regulator [Candidatus Neomarinimicrobiota bacterium]
MKHLALTQNNFTSLPSGANITFHRLKWDTGRESISLNAGPDLRYHTLVSDATALHTHEFAEFFLIISGKIKHLVNSEYQELQTGTLVFIRPTDVHGFEQLAGSACEIVNVAFKLEFLRDLSAYLGNDYFLRKYTGPVTSPMFKLSLSETDELANQLIRMNALQSTAHDIARLKIKIMIANIFTRFFLDAELSGVNSERPEWFEQLNLEMVKHENLCGGLERMKQLAPCTQEHLCKCFRKYLDKTPTEFINEQRIKQAAKQIVETDAKILAVAMELGFLSLSRFYSMFKKFYGISPAKYRLMSRQNDIPL